MKHSFTLHDYDNCLVSLANSVLNRFGSEPSGKTLSCADKYLEKGFRNVVVLILDGLGTLRPYHGALPRRRREIYLRLLE